MFLTFEQAIDLTSYEDNPSPKLVKQLSLIHESEDGELVQYFIDPESFVPADKNTFAIGVYNSKTEQYEYHEYPSLLWNKPKRRITTRRVDRLGLKAFPGVGACAFYKLAYQVLSKIVIPVNKRQKLYPYPTQSVTINGNTLHFEFTDPEKVSYQCYRVVLRCGEYAEEHITYEHELDCPFPQMNGEYEATTQGYISEGEEVSELSPEFTFTVNLPEQKDTPPTTTAGSDVFVSGLSFTQDNKLRAVLTDGRTVDSVNMVPEELPSVGISDKGKFLMVDEQGQWAAIKFADIVDPLHHQLLRFNSLTGKWENYTSMLPNAAESAAHIVTVTINTAKKITVEVDSLLRDNVSPAYIFVVDDLGETIAVQSTNVQSPVKVQVTLATNLTGDFTVTVLKEAFKSPQTDAGPFEVTIPNINLANFINTTEDMTLVNWSSDDGTTSLTLPAEFVWPYNGAERINNIVIGGNSFVGLGRSSEDVRVNRRDTYIQRYYWQYITGFLQSALKLRWEGWSPYSSRDDNHKYIWELFLIDNGDAFIHLVSRAGSTTWDGTFIFNGVNYTLNPSAQDVSFYREGTSGTAASDWHLENKIYEIGG